MKSTFILVMTLGVSLTGNAAGTDAVLCSAPYVNSAFSANYSPALTSEGEMPTSGTLEGTSITWTLNEEGVLTLSGSGSTPTNYSSSLPSTTSTATNLCPFVRNVDLRAAIKSVVIEEGITVLGNYLFNGCTNLEKVSFPSTLTKINTRTFKNCPSLNTVGISDLEKWCGLSLVNTPFEGDVEHVFVNGVEITKLDVPSTVKTIKQFVFKNFKSITSISIPASVTDIKLDAFQGCDNIDKVLVDDLASWCKIAFENNQSNPLCYAKKMFISGEEVTSLSIPSSVTVIKKMAFANMVNLKSVTLPDALTTIQDNAFSGCTNLLSVSLPEGVTSIGESAFSDCDALQSITIPGKVVKISTNTFSGCTSLASVSLPDGVTTIGQEAFLGCANLTSMVLPKSLTSIETGAFRDCDNLASVTLSDNIKTIYSYAFKNCSNLASINLPNSIETIDEEAFLGCTKLSTIVIPTAVTQITDKTFYNCTGLTSLTLPAGLTSIGASAFEGCTHLYELRNLSSLPLVIGSEDYGFVACYAMDILTSADEPSIFQKEGDFSFRREKGVYKLIEYSGSDELLRLPAKCNHADYAINGGVFEGKTFTAIIMPESVVGINENALSCCTFKVLVCEGNTPPTLNDTGLKNGQRIVVPAAHVEKYKNAWGMSYNFLPILDVMFFDEVSASAYTAALSGKDKANITSVAFYGEGLGEDLTTGVLADGMNPNCLYLVPASTAVKVSDHKYINTVDFDNHAANSIDLTDGYAYNSPIDFHAQSIRFVHHPSVWATGKSGWETIVLPFEATDFEASTSGMLFPILRGSTGDFWLRKYVGSNTKSVYFSSLDEAVMLAQTPYLVAFPGETMGVGHLQGQTITFGAANVDIAVTAVPTQARNQFTFTGNYDTAEDGVTGFALNASGSSFVATTTVGKEPFQAYFVSKGSSSDVRSLGITFGTFDEETGIFSVDEDVDAPDGLGAATFDLSGRRVASTAKGVYIVNGKKMVKR